MKRINNYWLKIYIVFIQNACYSSSCCCCCYKICIIVKLKAVDSSKVCHETDYFTA